MASKKFKGKTCAYCCREGASEAKEHVIAREFVVTRDRDNLPAVPACNRCNTEKSALETYALAVLPFGSVLPHSQDYIEANLERRLAKHPKLKRELGRGTSREWIRQNGAPVSVLTIPLDHERINGLVAMILRGLFNYEYGVPLHAHWAVQVGNLLPAVETALVSQVLEALGPEPERLERAISNGTVNYTAWRSRWWKYQSFWRLTMFGGLSVGGDEEAPGMAFDHWSAVTVRNDEAPMPPDEDEMPDVEGLRAWIAARKRSSNSA